VWENGLQQFTIDDWYPGVVEKSVSGVVTVNFIEKAALRGEIS